MADFPVKISIGAAERLSAVLARATSGVKKLADATRNAQNRFTKFQQTTAGFRKSMASAGKSMRSAGRSLSLGVTTPLTGAGFAVIKTAATFEKSINRVRALTQDFGDEMSEGTVKLRKLAKELGKNTAFSASQAADAMGFLAMAGFEVNEIFDATPSLLNLAAATQTDLARSADFASNIMGGFGIGAKDTGKVVDILSAVTASANVDLTELAETMKIMAPIAKDFGADITEAGAAAGLLGNLGIKGTAAGTALRQSLLALAGPTTTASKLLKTMGIEVFDKTANKMRKFEDIMADMAGRLSELPQDARLQVLNAVFGKIAITAASSLEKVADTGELQQFAERLRNVDGISDKMAKTMLKGAAGAMAKFKSATEALAIEMGDSGVLGAITDALVTLTGFVGEIAKANPKFFRWAFIIGIVAAALGPLTLAIGGVLAILPAIVTGVGLVGVAFKAAFGPIGILVAVLVAAGIALVKNWDSVKAFFMGLWPPIVEAFNSAWNGLKSFISTAWQSIRAIFIENPLLGILMPVIGIPLLISENWTLLKASLAAIWASIVEAVSPLVNAFMDFGKVVVMDVVGAVSGAFHGLMTVGKMVFEGLVFIAQKAAAILVTVFSPVVEVFKTVFNFLNEGFKKFLGSIPDFLVKKLGIKTELPETPEIGPAEKLANLSLAGKLGPAKGLQAPGFGPEKRITGIGVAGPQKTENKVVVDFSNLPSGTKIKTETDDDTLFELNTGLQGAAR